MKLWAILILIAMFAVLAGNPNAAATIDRGTVIVYVMNKEFTKMEPNACILVDNVCTGKKTGSDGSVRISMSPGIHRISAEKVKTGGSVSYGTWYGDFSKPSPFGGCSYCYRITLTTYTPRPKCA